MREGRRDVREATEQTKLEVMEKRKIQQRSLRKMIRKEVSHSRAALSVLVGPATAVSLGSFLEM